MDNDAISIFGTRFVAEVDFADALKGAQGLQGVIQAIPGQIEKMVRDSKAHLAQLTSAFQQAAAAGAAIGAAGAGGGGSGGGALGAFVVGPQSSGSAVTGTPRYATPPSQQQRLGLNAPAGDGFLWSRPAGALPPPSPNWVFHGGGPSAQMPYPNWAPYSNVGGMVHVGRAWTPGGGGFTGGLVPPPPPGGMSGGFGGMPQLPGPVAAPVMDAQFGQVRNAHPNAWYMGPTQFTGAFRNMGGGFGRVFNYQNMMRAAAGLYVGQQAANLVSYAGRSTIGQAMYLEERQALLENALMSDKLGITREHARSRAAGLTSASYFAGMPVTAQEMGLSRVELAEQFRQLAPIIRLTAQNQDEFQSGLQTGALARALLVARDPVQGTKGSMVALSELYSGGPDRFRSLALRFELPRNRLLEIEQEHGGADAADPGQVLIQMLSEMGFGPSYLVMRSGTLAGQLDRSGALFENARVELYGEAMDRVRDNLTRLNDAFETFLDSDAGDRVIDWFDQLFGRATGAVTNPLTSFLAGPLNTMTAGGDPARLGANIAQYMQARGGEYVTASGQIVSAGEAFQEAAQLITSKQFAQAARAAPSDPGLGLLGMTGGGMVAGTVGFGLMNRMLLAGQGTAAWQTLMKGGGLRAAGSALGAGFLAGGAIPMAGLALTAGAVSLGVQSGNLARDWQAFAAMHPELAAQADINIRPSLLGGWLGAGVVDGSNLTGTAIFRDRVETGAYNVGAGITNFFGGIFGQGERHTPRTSVAQTIAQDMHSGGIKGALRTQAAMLALENSDATLIRTTLADTVYRHLEGSGATMSAAEIGEIVDYAMLGADDLNLTGLALSGVALGRATSTGLQLVGPDAAQMTMQDNTNAGIAALWQQVLAHPGADTDADGLVSQREGLEYLKGMLQQLNIIAKNTGDEDARASSYIRPSMAGDIFTGYVENPDMRFTHRTGLPLPAAATSSATSSLSGAITARVGAGAAAGAGYTYELERAGHRQGERDAFFGGTITSPYRAQRDGHQHGGLDYVLPIGTPLTAPAAGSVEYLTTAEDYARYAGMFSAMNGDQVGTYGVSAVFRDDVAGALSTYSHLDAETPSIYGGGAVRAGQAFGKQGSTGKSSGPHVHYELWMPDGGGGYDKLDPGYAADYYGSLGAMQQSVNQGVTINVSMDGHVFHLGGESANAEEIVDELLANPRYRAALVANLAAGLAASPSAAVSVMQAASSALTRRGQN